MLDELRTKMPAGFIFQAVAHDEVKQYACAQVTLVGETQVIMAGRGSAMGNWMAVSLLLLNCGAALAFHGAAAQSHHAARLTELFLSGIFVALLNRWLLLAMVSGQARFLVKTRDYWRRVASDGVRSPTEEAALLWLSRKSLRRAVSIPVPALLSVATWAWGYFSLISAQNFAAG